MDTSLSLPDPGEFHHPLQNGHAAGLVVDHLAPFDPAHTDADHALDQADLRGDGGILPLDPADVAEALITPGLELGPDLIEAQTRILEQELRTELDRLDADALRDADPTDAKGGSYCNFAQEQGPSGLLPGFEALTWRDLRPCPPWCADADLPLHGDGFDNTAETEVPHRGVSQDIPIKHGGKSLDHAGRAEVSAQLEQERDLATGPVITLGVVVRGIEQYAWLTSAEATALRRTLGQLLDDANGRS